MLIILLPAGRFFTIPFPPGPLAARVLAAVIRPPLLFFAIMNFFLFVELFTDPAYGAGMVMILESKVTAAIRVNARPFSVAPVVNVMD